MGPGPKYEELRIPLREPAQGLTEVSGVLGMPEWWPTGARVSVVLAHSTAGNMDEPVILELQRALTERKYLTLRFNFPYAEVGKRRHDPMPVLQRTLRSAIAMLGRDPTAAPAHLFLAGKDLGGVVAAQTAAGARLRVEGLCFLGFPLHAQDNPDRIKADALFRIICPMLFVQGTRDRQCQIDALRRTLSRVGAPSTLHLIEEADHGLRVPRKVGRAEDDVRSEIRGALEGWIGRVLGGN